MKTYPSNAKQNGPLTNTEQFLCKCGCGEYGFNRAIGRKREYINETHKTRAKRARRKARQTEARVYLTPKGIQKAEQLAKTNYARIWDMLTIEEQWMLDLAQRHPEGVEVFWRAVAAFQQRVKENKFSLYGEG